MIHLDPPEIHTAGVVNLYTREFYESAGRTFKPGGILSHWVNVYLLPEPETMLVRTVLEVFPHTTIWQGPRHYSFNFICSDRLVAVDLPRFTERLAIPAVPTTTWPKLTSTTPMTFSPSSSSAKEGVRRFAGGAPPVTTTTEPGRLCRAAERLLRLRLQAPLLRPHRRAHRAALRARPGGRGGRL